MTPNSKADIINSKSTLSDRKLVPDSQIQLFCEILRFQYNLGEGHHDEFARRCYINRIRPLLPKLKFPLAKPTSLIRKLFLPEQSRYTSLCDMHSSLNADFVHQWFKFVALEVGARMEILRSSDRKHIGPYAWDNVIIPLTRLHMMWLNPEQLHEAFCAFAENEVDPSVGLMDVDKQADGCEACILARIGGWVNTVISLQTVVRSRITPESHAAHPRRLRLLRLTEPWIQHYRNCFDHDPQNESRRSTQTALSMGMAEVLYEKRKELELDQHRRRRAERHLFDLNYSSSRKYSKVTGEYEEDYPRDEYYDAENDIIDHYAALRATQRASTFVSINSNGIESVQRPVSNDEFVEHRLVRNTEERFEQPSVRMPFYADGTEARISTGTVWPMYMNANGSHAELHQPIRPNRSAQFTRLDTVNESIPTSPSVRYVNYCSETDRTPIGPSSVYNDDPSVYTPPYSEWANRESPTLTTQNPQPQSNIERTPSSEGDISPLAPSLAWTNVSTDNASEFSVPIRATSQTNQSSATSSVGFGYSAYYRRNGRDKDSSLISHFEEGPVSTPSSRLAGQFNTSSRKGHENNGKFRGFF